MSPTSTARIRGWVWHSWYVCQVYSLTHPLLSPLHKENMSQLTISKSMDGNIRRDSDKSCLRSPKETKGLDQKLMKGCVKVNIYLTLVLSSTWQPAVQLWWAWSLLSGGWGLPWSPVIRAGFAQVRQVRPQTQLFSPFNCWRSLKTRMGETASTRKRGFRLFFGHFEKTQAIHSKAQYFAN